MSDSDVFFEPAEVCNRFLSITQRSHPSGDENPVREYVFSQAQEIPNVKVVFYDPQATAPGKRVIVLQRPGSGVYARHTPVILQAHMDMVTNPEDMAFPLNVIPDTKPPLKPGKWIKATEKGGRDSTLGADDGLGVATALALLVDKNLQDYPLECLFTVQEETDMGGAQNFDLKLLTGQQLLNLDAEVLPQIIFGSAGGSATEYSGKISRKSIPTGYTTLQLSISGLRGGHSGVDVNKGRLNAIKVMGQVLTRLDKRITALDISGQGIASYDLLINDIQRCDVKKSNAIPAYVQAFITLPSDKVSAFTTDFNALCTTLKDQNLPEEDGFQWEAKAANTTLLPLDEASTDNVLCLLQQLPSGVISMIPSVPGVVETSSNLYAIALTDTTITLNSSNRSSREDSLKALNTIQANIGTIFQFNVTTGIDSYPSWQPNPESNVLQIAKTVYEKMYGDKADATVIHAGLECGTIYDRYKSQLQIEMDCISIGPSIKDPHSPNESMEIQDETGQQTVQQFYDAVANILHGIFQEA